MNNRANSNRTNKLRARRISRLRTLVLYLQVGVLLVFGVGIGGVVGTFISVSRMLPRITDYSPPEVTKIYSSDNVLLATVGEENREFVSLKKVPKHLINATVAIEDSRFYEHAGVDLRGIVRSLVENIKSGEMSQGGSTITQQLARNVYLTPKKTLTRKAREAVLAVLIERNYTKPEIIELYLNQVYFGSGAFGVEAASKVYFGKSVNRLNLAESALLAGLPRRPSSFSPHTNLRGAIERRNVVLARMAELDYITPEERDRAKEEKPRIEPLKPTKYRSKAPYLTDYVKRYLREEYSYGDDLIYRGGLRVYTTVNYKMQAAAQKALTRGIERARQSRQMDPVQGNGALVCIEPATGYIRAMVGGADYQKSEFNRAVQARRQPGSSFKVFVYTAAVDTLGWDADHIVEGGRFYYRPRGGPPWSPRNYDGKWWGNMPMKKAVAKSVNIPAIKTAMKVGLHTVIRYAQMMGIKSELQAYPSIAIGGVKGIRPIEMAAAYGIFAANGYYAEPTPIAKITDSKGELVEERSVDSRRILPEKTVKVVDELFRAVVETPGGTGYRVLHDFPEARGKTGTTNEDVDAWFIGYVPGKLVTAVWAGNDNYKPMKRVWGGTVCAPVWKEFMWEAIKVYDQTHRSEREGSSEPRAARREKRPTEKSGQKERPTETDAADEQDETTLGTVTVRICSTSELRATRWCPPSAVYTYTFVEGTEPNQDCNVHGPGGGAAEGEGQSQPEPPGGRDSLRLTPPPPILPDR